MAMSSYSGPLTCDFKPDVDTAWRFLEWWFQYCTRGLLEIGWQNPATGGLMLFRRFDLGDMTILRAMADENMVPGQSMYVRASTIDPASPIGRTQDIHVLQAPGAWADLDTAEQVRLAKLVEGHVRANGFTRTGKVPHERYQLWLRGSEPMVAIEQIRLMNRRMHMLYGGDPAVCNPGRLMRLPGTIAWPYKAGRVVELTTFEAAPSPRPANYPLSTMSAMLPRVPDQELADLVPERPAPGEGDLESKMVNLYAHDAAINPIAGLISDILGKRTPWHNGMIKLVAHWVGVGWCNAEILLACEGLTLPGWTPAQTREEAFKAIEGARRKWQVPDRVVEVKVPAAPVAALIFHEATQAELQAGKMRQWIYGHFLMRGFVSVLGAPGGYGKTAYAKAVALAIVSGQKLIEEDIHEQVKVAIWNLEDPYDEMLRRLHAAVLYHELDQFDWQGRLFMNSGRDRELTVATRNERGVAIATEDVARIVAQVREKGIGVVIVDPFVRSHKLEENSNVEMDFVAALWARVATEANCAVLLVHHFRKGGEGGDADAFRGASAVINAARAAISLTRMTLGEAANLRVEMKDRWRYLRVDNAKLNTAPPPQDAVWLKLVSVPLPNGPGGNAGDNVQTVERWQPPSPWEGLTAVAMVAVLEQLAQGVDGEFYAPSRRGKDNERWAGNVVLEHAGTTTSEDQARYIIGQWLKSGLLVEGKYHSQKQRRDRVCVRPDPAMLTELKAQQASHPSPE
jgi:hypothetical protein